ncbi:molybdate ABC transporter permease subunit [Effusibacillus lacus]|uniref:Molybdenum transport system permease n=1 Tax=Effusibacillus lacus TaxID=1348429 RepID=A0A292YIQ9_9BACL|nr:molybdate ABC transporter permease subunit [Effusibacillus lacus]TCS67842.1 molybdate transport system permease protein [Effusibacillus lacus]GAX89818.1 molybdenum ABC transporter permease subunit [Effusibacillus lacus]
MTSMWTPVWLSLQVAGLATCIVAVLGTGIARWMQRSRLPVKELLDALFLLPMVLPPTVTGFLLLWLFGKKGPIGQMLAAAGIEIPFTFAGAVIAASVVSFPLMYQSAFAGFLSVDRKLEIAGLSLGASGVRTFWQVTLPLATPGLLSGIVLTFARALGEFGATLMLAGNIPGITQTIPLAIYTATEAGYMKEVSWFVAVMTVVSFGLVFLVKRWSRLYTVKQGGRWRA